MTASKFPQAPKILLNVCTHGNERVGLKVAEYFSHLKVTHGILQVHIANMKAVKARKRFIDSDLNRVFPGKKNGDYEERLAYEITPSISSFDLVIDIHSTNSGMRSTIITVESSNILNQIIRAIGPKYAVCMSATKSNSLISHAKHGIAFEYGKDGDQRTYTETVRGIKRALAHLGMLQDRRIKQASTEVMFFDAYATFAKPKGYSVHKKIKNFSLVRKGAVVGTHRHKDNLLAPENFYPILFGENSYKTMFGFIARKIS